MEKNITLIFHNQGLRSYIEVDLCRECPRQDDKGCCGFYSPVFYPCDFVYLLNNQPDLLQLIFNLPGLTVLDHSVTVNNIPEGDSYRCQFHSKTRGCRLEQLQRESICRHFVCPGIDWESDESLKHWKEFFQQLADFENDLNHRIAARLAADNLTLREAKNRPLFFEKLLKVFAEETAELPAFFHDMPDIETARIKRTMRFKHEWTL